VQGEKRGAISNMKTIKVTGDVTIDWIFINPKGPLASQIDFNQKWETRISCQEIAQAGGSALLARILEEIANSSGSFKVAKAEIDHKALLEPGFGGYTRSFMSWSPFPKKKGYKREYAWRISEFWGEAPRTVDLNTNQDNIEDEDLLIIDDSNQGFRENTEKWSPILNGDRKGKPIILKMFTPICEGSLWENIAGNHPDVTTAIVSLSDLRKSRAQIGYALSWEQMYSEVLSAVTRQDLLKVSRVIVLLGTVGAILVERGASSCLVFDPYCQEGDWEKKYPGQMVGYSSCMMASIANEIISNPGKPDLVPAMKRGLGACRTLHLQGFDESAEAGSLRLSFPYGAVVETLLKDEDAFADICMSFAEDAPSSILAATITGDFGDVAMDIALRGPSNALSSVPIERIGNWSSVDRDEIESMRSVQNILSKYVSQYSSGTRLERPLSIAVFGPPGSGKSFAIKQMAKALFPDQLKKIEFNLSQLDSPQELGNAFHQVRDLALEQQLPLVFWDEFDAVLDGMELGWLRYFLAPMQDGEFREAGVSHPVGPAIFVFAGGTCDSIDEFKLTRDEQFEKQAKKKDFISRLKGYVNILGPNPLKGGKDCLFPLRRALLLRAFLMSKADNLFDGDNLTIDEGVLRAFLMIDEYLHGARSMEAIVDTSAITGKVSFERSYLPASHQLALHVDSSKFLALIDS